MEIYRVCCIINCFFIGVHIDKDMKVIIILDIKRYFFISAPLPSFFYLPLSFIYHAQSMFICIETQEISNMLHMLHGQLYTMKRRNVIQSSFFLSAAVWLTLTFDLQHLGATQSSKGSSKTRKALELLGVVPPSCANNQKLRTRAASYFGNARASRREAASAR